MTLHNPEVAFYRSPPAHIQSGERGRRSRTEGDTYRELAPAHLLRQSKVAEALLVYGILPPTMIDLRPWFEDQTVKTLKGRA